MSDFAEKKFPHRMDLWVLGRLTPTGAVNFSPFSRILLLQLPSFPCKIQLSPEKEAPCMSEDFGPTFLTVTDEEGKELVLEFMDAL